MRQEQEQSVYSPQERLSNQQGLTAMKFFTGLIAIMKQYFKKNKIISPSLPQSLLPPHMIASGQVFNPIFRKVIPYGTKT